MSWGSNKVNVEVDWKPERTLVLLGRTGNGKSATGNSILGETKFLSKTRGRFITKECKLHTSMLSNGQRINVIDTPGLFSASSTPDFTIREIVRCLRLAKDGIDAVILVFSVRNRLTEEEQLTLRTLKILFGSQIVDYMIVVFTNGDAFEDGDTLDDYLEDCPEFQEILKECDDRKVLFDNRRNIPKSTKDKQVQDLLNFVEQISKKNNGKPFMADLSLELRENEATLEEKQKQIQAMKGQSKQEISQVKKEMEKTYNEMLEGIKEKIANQLKESLNDVKEQLAKAQLARAETEKKMTELQNLSSDEIRRLREQLNNAERETARLRRQQGSQRCSVL
ncbi:hypothetical protein N665_0047s0015 [Sinapis alba]|nr:hypothetical protein N665_0047s0015 [Sinapis alba]